VKKMSEVKQTESKVSTTPNIQPIIALASASNIVRINVGGNIYSTSISTLRKERSLLSDLQPGQEYFIDRNPEYFGFILDSLRKETVDLEGLSPKYLRQLKDEVDYYQLASLSEYLAGKGRLTFQYPSEDMVLHNDRLVANANGFALASKPKAIGSSLIFSVRIIFDHSQFHPSKQKAPIFAVGWSPLVTSKQDGYNYGESITGYYLNFDGQLFLPGQRRLFPKAVSRYFHRSAVDWESTDILTCVLEIGSRSICYSLNGKNLGTAFTNVTNFDEIYPAVFISKRVEGSSILLM